ncbi:MAG: ATP-binding protein [Colwellia sp.]|jgi:ATPases of the AAA+ class
MDSSDLLSIEVKPNEVKPIISRLAESGAAAERLGTAKLIDSSVLNTDFYSDLDSELSNELQWLEQCINHRIAFYFKSNNAEQLLEGPDVLPDAPVFSSADGGYYAELIQQRRFNNAERLVFILALAPYFKPQLLDIFFSQNELFQRIYTEFGGIKGNVHGGFLPTLETALFVLAGGDMAERLALMRLFNPQHALFQQELLLTLPAQKNEPLTCAVLTVCPRVIERLLGLANVTLVSAEFPATCLSTEKSWSDLILTSQTSNQLEELEAWLQFGEQLLAQEGHKQFKPGYRCLFYGPPGTGKTFTASLLGQHYARQVYRIDLSQLVSKYIGETEKNLEKVFVAAEKNNWILFFDEADSLFAKRTQINSSNDRHANQGTAYLLQRIEECTNVVILASNLKNNFDQAFIRRFQSFVYFPLPGKRERLQLWQLGLNHSNVFQAPTFSLDVVAEQFELPGGSISNVIRYVSLMALKNKTTEISLADLKLGIRRELAKEGKSL